MLKTAEERKNSKAAIANSLERAESLSVTPELMRRYIDREDPQAYLIVQSWQPARFYSRFIVTVEAINA